ncbi:hypothetical protein [Sphaerotilus sp.]|uniref:hypothetical protein n=1 Tax=Sphaerotilus sp. TaxID=2093942 RepID=UPI002ACE498F|nr:hypothetical protein [Sphaerotilus sp.]MDZ7855554.1 hypothetical protein [Sphaerotilus sp.]
MPRVPKPIDPLVQEQDLLFSELDPPPREPAVQPQDADEALHTLARQLSPRIHLGTSS